DSAAREQNPVGDSKDPFAMIRAAWNDYRGHLQGNVLGLFASPARLDFRQEGVSETVGIGLPLLRRPTRLFQDLAESYRHLNKGNLAEAEKILVRAERETSESTVYLLLGRIHVTRGEEARKRRDRRQEWEELRLAYDSLARAVDAPTLVPASRIRRGA